MYEAVDHEDNYSLLLSGIRNDEEKKVEELVRKGIFLKKDSASKETEVICPLELAISSRKLSMIRILLRHAACVSARIRCCNETALQYAAMIRQRAMLLELLRRRGTVDWRSARDEKGATLMHLTFELGALNFEARRNGTLRRRNCSKSTLERKIIEVLDVLVSLGGAESVSARTNSGETPLRLALREGMLEVADYLLRHKANVNVCDNEGNSLLQLLIEDHAGSDDNDRILRWLLARGANVNSLNSKGETAVQLAVRRGLKGVLLVLLDFIEVGYVNSRGETWLHVFLQMSERERTRKKRRLKPNEEEEEEEDDDEGEEGLSERELDEIAEELVEMGVSVDAVDCYGSTSLHLAALQRKPLLVLKMLEHFENVSACDGLGRTALHLLVDRCVDESRGQYLQGYVEAVRDLLAKGADASRASKDGLSAVQLAAKHRHVQMLWIFKEHGAKLAGLVTAGGETLLHLVAKRFTELRDSLAEKMAVDMLVSQGCDVNARSRSGATPLHLAALYGNAQVARSLLKHEAQVDSRDGQSQATPLHMAMDERLVDILAYGGADLDARDKNGWSALHWAANKGELALARKLLELGADPKLRDSSRSRLTALHLAVQRAQADMVELLIDGGADLEAACARTGSTALHLSVERGSLELSRCLLELGADVEARDTRERSTPLHLAARVGSEDLIQLLLDYAAKVDARQAFGETALHVAVKYLRPRLARLLLRAGAKVDAKNANGRTALRYAVEYRSSESLGLLLQFGADASEALDGELLAAGASDDCDMACHVVEHLLALRALGLVDGPEALSIEQRGPQFERLHDECRDEVARLQAYRLPDRRTLLDLMRMNPQRRFACINANRFRPENVEHEFPRYYGLVWRSYYEAIERRSLLDAALDLWYLLTDVDLPSDCVERVLEFLDNRSLENLIQAAEAIELEEIC